MPKAARILVLVAICFVTVACHSSASNSVGVDYVDDHRLSPVDTYLQKEISPCTPVPGSNRDPCAVREAPDLPSNATDEYFIEIPNYWDLYFDATEKPSVFTPHLVIRATFLVDTTRCSIYERNLPTFTNFSFAQLLLTCFVDARVNSYLVGTGPPTLSISVHNYLFLDGSDIPEWLIERDRVDVAAVYEGREGVLFLAPSSTTVVEAWWMTEFWDVQHTGGDTLNVVAPYKHNIEHMIKYGFASEELLEKEFTPENLALLERPLSEFETVIRDGAVARAVETKGRIGVGDNLPMLITDANLLRPYYEGPGVGISYETDAPALPPPVPGGKEPVGPPANTGEDPEEDQTPPAPGDDTPRPASTPEDTTTTTTSTTTTTTTTTPSG